MKNECCVKRTEVSKSLYPKAKIVSVLVTLAICIFCHSIGYSATADNNTELLKGIQQDLTINGNVVDTYDFPLIGVSVVVEGTSNIAITDENGYFSINAKNGDVLNFSFMGFISESVTVSDAASFNIVLREDIAVLDEVVVVGFGTQKKTNLTGSVSVVDAEAFESRPVLSASDALQGVVAGLTISRTSGSLGESSSINVRGQGTIGDGSSGAPLILIDGMEGDINTINPQDIASVSVLKDAASSSIYGSRAPFGVIMITTKKGKSGKLAINYNNSFRLSTQTNLPDMMDSYEMALFLIDGQTNSHDTPYMDDEYLARILAYRDNPGSIPSTIADGNEWEGSIQGANDNIDWLDDIYRDWTFGQEHNFSISGGSDKQQVYASVNYLNQGGFSTYDQDRYKRLSTNLRATGNLIENIINYSYNIKFQKTDFNQPTALDSFDVTNGFVYPITPRYDPNGYLMENPQNTIDNGGTQTKSVNSLYQQLQLVANPLDGWNITAELNSRIKSIRNHTDVQDVWVHNVNEGTFLATSYPTSYVEETSISQNYTNLNLFSDYSFDFNNDHNFKVMGGFQYEGDTVNDFSVSRQGVIIAGSGTLDMTDGTDSSGSVAPTLAEGYIEEWATAGFFARLNYDYKGRYLFEVNARYDGTSRFRSDKRWAMFPSFSLGWNIAQESFFESLQNKITTLKLRASYGELGNQNTDNLYPTYAEMLLANSTGYWLVNGVATNTATAPDMLNALLTWERVKSTNIGIDLSALNSRLNFNFDWFNRQTVDMVGPAVELPATLGTDVPKTNNTDLTTRGWELNLSWRDVTDGDFGYSIGFVLSDYQTTLNSYPNEGNVLLFSTDTQGAATNNGMSDQYIQGQKLGDIWGYTTIGIAKTDAEMLAHLATLPNGGQTMIPDGGDADDWGAGDIMYKDINGDGKISSGAGTADDPGDMSVIGNTTPRYTFGINLAADYKGFDISLFFQGVMKRDYAMNSSTFFGCTESTYSMAPYTNALDYFRDDPTHPLGLNLDSYYPRPLFSNKKNAQIQTAYLLDASYIRLKNIQLGYTFNDRILEKMRLSNLRVFLSGENLWTGTSLPDMFDPETIDGTNYGMNYPMQATVSFGINVSF